MSAKTINADIILNLSPVNNIMDAFKNFGIREDCNDVIVIRVIELQDDEDVVDNVVKLVGTDSNLNDQVLFDLVDLKRFKKVYKLNDAKFTDTQQNLSNLAIGACILRGC
ncbi:EKC/KEOPS complex subunit [Spathaspora sp. JA1]|nr:EKC/KEOPS complex subunit [Spathaspora sp. JA1]